jgi:hypothetical protein
MARSGRRSAAAFWKRLSAGSQQPEFREASGWGLSSGPSARGRSRSDRAEDDGDPAKSNGKAARTGRLVEVTLGGAKSPRVGEGLREQLSGQQQCGREVGDPSVETVAL